jgi:hypothetical protein
MGLIINQGSPNWWLSPDIWVTLSGAASTSPPGVLNPVVGQVYDVWCRVTNPTPATISDWSLMIYWAIPTASIILLTNCTPLNETTISVPGGTSQIFQAATKWRPVFENGGHECLVAFTYWNGIAYPFQPFLQGDTGPGDDWSIAQHNLSLVQLKTHPRIIRYPFLVCNSATKERECIVSARQAPLAEVEWFMKGLPGGRNAHEREGKVQGLGLMASANLPDTLGIADITAASPVLGRVKLGPRSCGRFSLVGGLDAGTALIHVTQTIDNRIVGGLSVLVQSEG